MQIPIRILNVNGIEAFRSYIMKAREGYSVQPPFKILEDNMYTDELNKSVEITNKDFNTKRELAKYINIKLNEEDIFQDSELTWNRGLWSWLALFFFDLICPEENGKRNVYKDYYYIYDIIDGKPNWNTYYRHLIATPYFIYLNNINSAYLLLEKRPNIHGDHMEQIASRQKFYRSRNLIKVIDSLYYDFDMGRPKSGSASKDKPGLLRRLAKEILPQFDRTYDLFTTTPEDIINLLPDREFGYWKNS